MSFQKGDCFAQGNAAGLLEGKSIYPAADGGESKGAQSMFASQLEACLVAGGEQYRLFLVTTAPDWADRVDDVFRRQVVSLRDFGLSGFAAPEGFAFLQQARTCGPMDGSVHPASAEQGFVGGVDYGVDLEAREITFRDGYFVCHLIFSPWLLGSICKNLVTSPRMG